MDSVCKRLGRRQRRRASGSVVEISILWPTLKLPTVRVHPRDARGRRDVHVIFHPGGRSLRRAGAIESRCVKAQLAPGLFPAGRHVQFLDTRFTQQIGAIGGSIPKQRRQQECDSRQHQTSSRVTLILSISYTPNPRCAAYSICPGSRTNSFALGLLRCASEPARYFSERSHTETAFSALRFSSMMSISSRSMATGSVPIMIRFG